MVGIKNWWLLIVGFHLMSVGEWFVGRGQRMVGDCWWLSYVGWYLVSEFSLLHLLSSMKCKIEFAFSFSLTEKKTF